MQKDCTVFKIPNQPKASASDFDVKETSTIRVGGAVMGEMKFAPVMSDFKYYEELNNIAEELEKCRLRML
jgi:hypothetical protein